MARFAKTLAATVLALPLGCSDSTAIEPDVEAREFGFQTPNGPFAIPVPTDAFCSINVKNKGTKDMEGDYLPHVIACEAPPNADLEMLEAQAIAARSYVYLSAATTGSICDSQGCQVYSCGNEPTEKHYQAVDNTSGVIMTWGGRLTVGFFVAGDKTPNADCSGNSSGVANTEKWVTYNEGKTGTSITQTKLGWRHKTTDTDYGQNRGCLSQWGAQCLAEDRGYNSTEILQYYYGDDIGLKKTVGACVLDGDVDPDPDPDPEPEPEPVDPCTILADGETIIDNGMECFDLSGPSKYWRTENFGHGGKLNWTKSTKTTEYNVASWTLNPQEDGLYRVEAHIEDSMSAAKDAVYTLIDANASRDVDVDQTEGGWVNVGIVSLTAGLDDQMVRMTDAIGVSGQILQADAMRITPVDPAVCEVEDCGPIDAREEGPDGVADAGRGESAGCRAGGAAPSGALVLLALLGFVRRRES